MGRKRTNLASAVGSFPIKAASVDELRKTLSHIKIAVPERSKGRTSSDCEQWSICRFLATFADSPLLTYPIKIEKRERPDFLLTSAESYTGIEVTEAVDQKQAQSDAHWNRKGQPDVKFLDASDGFAGDDVEQRWLCLVTKAISKKRQKLAEPGFERFQRNWLIVYANSADPMLNLDQAISYLYQWLLAETYRQSFDDVFVEVGSSFLHVRLPRIRKHELVDLWSKSADTC